jgi:hypothetical protein
MAGEAQEHRFVVALQLDVESQAVLVGQRDQRVSPIGRQRAQQPVLGEPIAGHVRAGEEPVEQPAGESAMAKNGAEPSV